MIDISGYKPVLESLLYRGKAKVEIRTSFKNPKTKKTDPHVTIVYDSLPCLLSHSSSESGNAYIPEAKQKIKLFLDPKYKIPGNSRITVTQDGIVERYKLSGVANRYPGHQEITLEKWEKWA